MELKIFLSHCKMFFINYNFFYVRISHDLREKGYLSQTEKTAKKPCLQR